MQITLDDLDEIKDALVQWMRIWTGVRIQREEWVKKEMDAGRPGFAEHNRKAIETAKEHCARTSRIINKIKQMQEEIYELNERAPEEIDIMCHVTSIKENDS